MNSSLCILCDSTDLTALICGHILCSECIMTLVRLRNRKCPICRTRITWNIPSIQRHIKLRKIQLNSI